MLCGLWRLKIRVPGCSILAARSRALGQMPLARVLGAGEKLPNWMLENANFEEIEMFCGERAGFSNGRQAGFPGRPCVSPPVCR